MEYSYFKRLKPDTILILIILVVVHVVLVIVEIIPLILMMIIGAIHIARRTQGGVEISAIKCTGRGVTTEFVCTHIQIYK